MPKSKKNTTAAGEARRRATAQDRQAQSPPADAPQPVEAPAADRYVAADERRLLAAGARLLTALQEYRDVADRYNASPDACLEMDEAMGGLGGYSGQLEHELVQLHQAIGMIEEHTQIAPKSANGRAWKPLLSPRWLLYFADLAKPGDPGYLTQLQALYERHDARELDAECGRPTQSGAPCRSIPVYWPGRGRDSACNRHLTPEEKGSLVTIWAAIERGHSCPGCLVQAGQTCTEDELQVLPSGEWPRMRTFAGHRLHDARLELYAT